ncbi:MAG: DUF4412 domain-containing protein [Bacteroidales bacterium]|nr:DUF4412 domain-containing protein [Bacteroidales bacterium]
MKKHILFFISITLLLSTASAQYRLQYKSYSIGGSDTSRTEVLQKGKQIKIQSADKPVEHPIPGMAQHFTYIDYSQDTVISQLYYQIDESYYCGYTIQKRSEYKSEGKEKMNGYNCTKYSIVLFSNKIELWTTEDLKFKATPISGFADLPGVLVKYCRNGNAVMELDKVAKDKSITEIFPDQFGEKKSSKELNQLEKDKLVITLPIFDEEQICFNPKLEKPHWMAYDSVYHFANGTIILKRIDMSRLPEHYRVFAEVSEYSNGDAYDRTGSIFVIPRSLRQSFLNALVDSIGVLPRFTDKNGEQYQGMVYTNTYQPLLELMRFFTPFGVRHYNEYRSLPEQDWAERVYYKQDISDLKPALEGDVYIGAFIGNYDAGGHKLSLTLKAYPEDDRWEYADSTVNMLLPLFNTCNVMEMAGQNYGKFFRTDSLTVKFSIPGGCKELKLRYISTGHGGWDTGDEFVPKANTILIDGKPKYIYTPWREDCGTYRTSNPASGNFWNGMSSSDYSRSGWCPGTATQPVYFDLTDLEPGEHTLTIAIPQGEPEGGSFSSWCVSGSLVGTFVRKP